MANELDVDTARSIFEYRDGVLYWKVRTSNRVRVGYPVGSLEQGYLKTSVLGQRMLVHRIIFLIHHGYLPDIVDHVDCNPLNNCIDNLRAATNNQNKHNGKMRVNNTSGVKGVYWNNQKGKWQAQICVDGRTRNLGRYDLLSEAESVVKAARADLHKEFARDE